MAEEKNIKLFDMYSGYIFEKLYKKFPLCVDFVPDNELEQIYSSDDIDEDNMLVFCSTLTWLERNSFIHIASSSPQNRKATMPMIYHSFSCVELTLDGLNLLTSPTPKTLSKKSVGDDIVEKVKSGMFGEAGRIATKAMFEYGIKKVTGGM
jgi:hypothetical protein